MIGKCEYCGEEKHLELREDDEKLCDSCDAAVNPAPLRTFLTADNRRLSREAYVKYLEECAARWRAQPVSHVLDPRAAATLQAENEEQAKKVEAKAARIRAGRDE